ncbi:MAG: DUF503 domain-containing protein [Acidobacteria bacterium]|nr:DUF503 domain-containing protein [Acidobacteriota bacterium]
MIAHLAFDIVLPDSGSLKDKRQVLRSLRDRLRGRYNIAFAEMDYQDLWQRARIEIVSVSSSRQLLEQMCQKVMDEVEEIAGLEAVHDCSLDFIE